MTVSPQPPGNRADASAILVRLAGLWPRLAIASSQWAVQQARAVSGLDYSLIDYQGVLSSAIRFGWGWWLDPQRANAAQLELGLRYAAAMRDACGPDRPSVQTAGSDKRFQDEAWSSEPTLRLLRDLYLINSEWVLSQVRAAWWLERHDRHKLEFYTRQIVSALSPGNSPVINPRVRACTLETHGESLLQGLESLVSDLEEARSLVPITQADPHAFEVGRNLATTPGAVVFRNELIELIQLSPMTESVHRRPLLFVPPWINKYYVLDLQPENSLLRYMVEQGHTVFVISWVNPGTEHAATGFDAYLVNGPLAALDVVREITGKEQVNLCGFCIGGILTACLLAYLAAAGERPVRSATLLATMTDFSDIGDTAVFIDATQLASIEQHAARTGYLDGHHMKDMFSLLRENDLIWSYVVAGYLMGRAPPAFDILHWNADSTRLPAQMLTDFLRGIYMQNSLVERDRLTLADRPIDLRRIKTPCYLLSTIDDHIAPWRACYAATQLLAGPVEFVLGGSGHISGIVNPPARAKYGYRTSRHHPENPDVWLQQAARHAGSWWPHWVQWLRAHGGGQVKARAAGSEQYPALCSAPGTYVLAK